MRRTPDHADASTPILSIGRQKEVDLASSSGAGLVGLGLGALLGAVLRPMAIALVAVGVALHGWGMVVRHRGERAAGIKLPAWARWLYWTCWVALTLIVIRIVLTSLG